MTDHYQNNEGVAEGKGGLEELRRICEGAPMQASMGGTVVLVPRNGQQELTPEDWKAHTLFSNTFNPALVAKLLKVAEVAKLISDRVYVDGQLGNAELDIALAALEAP